MAEVFFNGPEGRVEGRYHHNPEGPAALVLHPHPLHGGTMNNKVVYKLYDSLVQCGFSVLRINFPGVGRSEGKFDNGLGELATAAAAIDWLQQNNLNANFYWVCGFSFGAWVAMQLLMRRPELSGFITLAPPVQVSNRDYDFSFLAPCPAPGLIVQGDQDSIVNESAVRALAEKLNKQAKDFVVYESITGADHFFRNHLDELGAVITNYVQERLNSDIDEDYLMRPIKKRRKPVA